MNIGEQLQFRLNPRPRFNPSEMYEGSVVNSIIDGFNDGWLQIGTEVGFKIRENDIR